jgi:hypothetical protein
MVVGHIYVLIAEHENESERRRRNLHALREDLSRLALKVWAGVAC